MIGVYKFHPDAKILTRNLKTDAGLDIYALHDTFLPLGSTTMVSTGVAVEVSEGLFAQIMDRSSLASKGLAVGGGVIDCGFNGEIKVIIHNLTNQSSNSVTGPFNYKTGYQIKAGDKIAQLVFLRYEKVEPVETKELWTSERGSKSLGSSGK